MKTPNLSLLEVTLPRTSLRRKAELCSIDLSYKMKGQSYLFQYWFIRYGDLLPSEELTAYDIPELLTLCPPNLPSYAEKPKRIIADGIATVIKQKEEKSGNEPEINRQEVARFLNRLGVIGLDSPRIASIGSRPMTKSDLFLWFRLSPEKSEKIWRSKANLEAFKKHLSEIRKGNEVPFWIVEENLRTLSRFARLTLALIEYPETKGERYAKRVVTAWQQVITVPDTADPASAKYDREKVWRTYNNQGLKVLSPENVVRIFDDFASRLNFFLKPFSSLIVTTEHIQSFKAKGYGLEVLFSAYCLNALKNENKVVKRCAVCRLAYIPTRNKKEGVYCRKCKNAVSQQEYRNRKKKK